MRPWLTAIIAALLVAAAMGTAVPVITSVSASTGDSIVVDPDLARPNRVLTLPLGAPDVVLTVRGRNLDLFGQFASLAILPAQCSDCECSNYGDAVNSAQQTRLLGIFPVGGTFAEGLTEDPTARTADFDGVLTTLQATFTQQQNFAIGGLICLRPDAGVEPRFRPVQFLGYISVRFDCSLPNTCAGTFRATVLSPTSGFSTFLNGNQLAVLAAQNAECRNGATVCSCFNDRSTIRCCNGRLYDSTVYKCCGDNTIVALGAACACNSNGDCAGTNEPSCCFATKYPELRNTAAAALAGVCYNPAVHRCCDTGDRYDPGQDQCCTINGIQSLNIPCPCDNDLHCRGGQVEERNTNQVCCTQVDPVPREVSQCTIYQNFPTGTGPYFAQRCLGSCIDPTYQLCCNGNACRREFEKCCNTTCCNNFVGACHRVRRSNAVGQQFNNLNFVLNPADEESDRVVVERCTTIQQMTPIRAFWIFIIPTAFLLGTFLGLAVGLVFANKAAARVFTWVERFIVFFAVILALLGCPYYFSPLYKYGAVIGLIAFWAIITAATRVRWINAVAIGALIFLQIYLYDPFHGSAYFNLAYSRIWVESPFAGRTDPRSNGILHTTRMMFPNVTTTNEAQWCTRYYDYFIYDPLLRDFERDDNPLRTTFGYCSRGYVMALYLIGGFVLLVSLLLLLLLIIALIARFRKEVLEPVELEVRAVPDYAY